MAVGSSVTWTHCSVRYEVTWGSDSRVRVDAPMYPRRRECVRADAPMRPCRPTLSHLPAPCPPPYPFARPASCPRGRADASARTIKKNKKKLFFGSCLLEKRGKKCSVFGFQSPSSAGYAGKAARRRRFFWPSSPSHPSQLYSSLGWLNSKVPKPFPPFSLRLIDVDGF
jgi:hypothetical protein